MALRWGMPVPRNCFGVSAIAWGKLCLYPALGRSFGKSILCSWRSSFSVKAVAGKTYDMLGRWIVRYAGIILLFGIGYAPVAVAKIQRLVDAYHFNAFIFCILLDSELSAFSGEGDL
eukprot:4215282-Ditylum_brightwellii.AAC.1